MGNRTAKFISALIGSMIAGAPLAAVSQNAPSAPATASQANAAGDCLASPKGTAPQGQHWFYRLERSTKRQCWYLRAEGGKAATSTQTANSAPQPDSPPPQSVQNARAEYIAPQIAAQDAPPAAAPQPASPTADNNAQAPAVAARWPDGSTATAPPPQAVKVAADAQPSAPPAASPALVASAAADAPADKPTGSLQTLMLVIGGALALAGLIASVIYRFAGSRVRVQAGDHRRSHWDNWDPQDYDASRAPWLDATPAPALAERPRPVDFDAVRPDAVCPQANQLAAFTGEIARVAAQVRPAPVKAAEPEPAQIELFEDEYEVEETAPQLAADDNQAGQPSVHEQDSHDDNARDEDAVDIDVITAMLERLAQEGPRLAQPSLEADLADLARSRRGQSAARA
ncbi:hypothetical protein [Bradyrhizobium commune]|uniref:Uncharacterized protein n=1 Tax=Bradyrhizobium commune TaxID=83627 RepID=A0A7S9DCH6_9BRAD|nr:hypothetical protein [Bradyrhizobium commune]QPF95271.1 hypothetical protein IC761_20795 [Bradyrhizobium commune]